MSPEYDDCPFLCAVDDEQIDGVYCRNCPSKQLADEFESNVKKTLEIREVDTKRFPFRFVNELIYYTLEMRETPPGKMTNTTARLVSLFRSEKVKLDRLKEWNNRPRGQ